MTRHLVIMAAGTGGHIIPGLAVAAVMQQRGAVGAALAVCLQQSRTPAASLRRWRQHVAVLLQRNQARVRHHAVGSKETASPW